MSAPPLAAAPGASRLMCDHLHETTSRYDLAQKLLTFLLRCPVCGTERVIESLRYEPDFRR